MIYLLSQMVLALFLAVVFGAALGWILHRTTQDKESSNLKSVINRQAQQPNQMQSEVTMLTDDYDELQRQSHDELIALREANQQIPYLSTNLEKSQLLVSQMLKKHESQVRELNTQNQTLTKKLKSLEEQEQAQNKLKADLDSERRSTESTVSAQIPVTPVTPDKPARPATPSASSQPSTARAASDTHRIISNARNASSWASAPLTGLHNDEPEGASGDAATIRDVKPVAKLVERERLDEDLDDVHVVVDEDIQGIDDFEQNSDTLELADATISLSDYEFDLEDFNEEFAQTIDNSTAIHLNADLPDTDTLDDKVPSSLTARHTAEPETELELPELPADVFDVDPFDHVIEIGDDLQKEIDDDTEDDSSDPFEPVERNDDLQQIVGIDAMTEKALNDLGITSYAQLAKLKHQEIETIANALKIGPGRIERDDWVGSARRQLEEVLDEL